MKIAIFGQTLYAGVMAGLWAESGHHVYWCLDIPEDDIVKYVADEQLNQLLLTQANKQQLTMGQLDAVPLDTEVYFFALNVSEQSTAEQYISHLAQRIEVRPKLMINGCSFGLHGTQKLAQFAPQDDWAYLPDVIQEGRAIDSFINLKQIIVGSRFLLFFIKLSRHCQRGTSQSTFLLGWESGIAWGVGLGIAVFQGDTTSALITALALAIVALIMYQFTHVWFTNNKNR